MVDDEQGIDWPARSLEQRKTFREQYEQRWEDFQPDRTVDPTWPKPWVIVGYSSGAVDAVLRIDYGAVRKDGVYHVPGGEIRREHDYHGLRGQKIGTLLVLPDPGGRRIDRIDMAIEVACRLGGQIVFIASGAPE